MRRTRMSGVVLGGLLASSTAVVAFAPIAAAPAAADVPPNIIVVMLDDMTLEQYEAFMPKTNAMMSATGTTYDDFVVTDPECCPSRATYLSGQHTHNHGVDSTEPPTGGIAALVETDLLPTWLDDAGYRTGLVGKYINGYGAVSSPYVPPGWDEWFAPLDPSIYWAYEYTVSNNGTPQTFGHAATDNRDLVLGQRALKFVDDAVGGEAPFFLTYTPVAPHIGYLDESAFESRAPATATLGALPARQGFFPPAAYDHVLDGYQRSSRQASTRPT